LLLGSRDVAAAVRSIATAKPDVVLNTLNGDSNVAFFDALRAAGLTADVVPTMSFSIAEEELRQLPPESMTGHYAAWNYFQTVPGGGNERFVESFRRRFGDEAGLEDHEQSFVLYKWKGRKLERTFFFASDQVVRAVVPSGEIRLGRGTLKQDT